MKKIFFSILLLIKIFFLQSYAQAPDWIWARSAECQNLTGLALGEGENITSDIWGNVYVTGFFIGTSISFGSIFLYNNQSPNYGSAFVAKYDSSGNIIWAKNSGGLGGAGSWGVATDNSGNVYMTGGFFWGSVFFDSDTLMAAGNNIFIVKYDSSGNELWAKDAGGTPLNSVGLSVTADPFGNSFITGCFESDTFTLGSFALPYSGNNDLFIAKYDAAGNVLWAKGIGDSLNDKSISITCDPSGNAYVTGLFQSPFLVFDTDTIFNANAPNMDMFIAKYDSSGNIVWAKDIGNTGHELGVSVATHFSNNIYVTGYSTSPSITIDTITLLNSNNICTFLIKYDSFGNILWAKSFSSNSSYSMSIAVDSLDNIYMTGSMGTDPILQFDSITISLPLGSNDPMFIVKYDSTGHAHWAKALRSGGDDNNGVAIGTNGSIYIGGDFIGLFIFGNDSLSSVGDEDIFVARLGNGSNVGISENNFSNQILIFPNPSFTGFQISNFNFQPDDEIILRDVLGKIYFTKKISSPTSNIKLQTSNFSNGIYFLEIKTKEGVLNKKVVVQH